MAEKPDDKAAYKAFFDLMEVPIEILGARLAEMARPVFPSRTLPEFRWSVGVLLMTVAAKMMLEFDPRQAAVALYQLADQLATPEKDDA